MTECARATGDVVVPPRARGVQHPEHPSSGDVDETDVRDDWLRERRVDRRVTIAHPHVDRKVPLMSWVLPRVVADPPEPRVPHLGVKIQSKIIKNPKLVY